MRYPFTVWGGVLLLAALLATGVTPALARQGPAAFGPMQHHGPVFGFPGAGPGGWTAFDAAAEALGLAPEELFAELHGGKSLEQIARARGVELKAVHDAVRAARADSLKEKIQKAVAAGRLSQAKADWLLEGLEKGYMPMGPWMGHGFHVFGGGCPGMPGLSPEGQEQG